MSTDGELLGSKERFTDVVEARIAGGEGPFSDSHPFLRTACRGLANRLNDEVLPVGFVMATELYINDMQTGTDGFSGEPMPRDVTSMPPVMNGIDRLTATNLAREAFGDDFAVAVDAHYEAIRNQ